MDNDYSKLCHEQPVRKASCNDCFYHSHCPGLNPIRGNNDADAERCNAYTDNKNEICICCIGCGFAKVVDGKHQCTRQGKLKYICSGWYDPNNPNHFGYKRGGTTNG